MNPLHARLALLRRRLRFVVTFRGACWLGAVVLGALAVAGLLDWLVHLPGLARAILLVGILSAAGWIAYRFLISPLRVPDDDLSLALRIEAQYPELNDALGSTVQFLDQPGDGPAAGSPLLRRFVVKRALYQVERLNFNRIVDTHGMRAAGLSLIAGLFLALPLVLLFPSAAWTALTRLADPFGTTQWPPQTQLTVAAKSRIAQGETFEIRGTLEGVIPESATVRFWFEGQLPSEQLIAVSTSDKTKSGTLAVRLEGEKVRKNFQFQVVANDAVHGWQAVTVLPPPRLVPLDGRPSPQVRLRYPDYTDLKPLDLPDGTGNVEAVAGTEIYLRAAADRPVKAWIEYRPEQVEGRLGGFLGLGLWSNPSLDKVPAQAKGDGRVFEVRFMPRLSGAYALRFEDKTGLGSTRLYDLRLLADPPPLVNLERPSASLDSLYVLPTAEITLKVLTEDPIYAVRTAFLEYRCGRDATPERLPLYDHALMGSGLPALLAAFAARPVPLVAPPLRLRPQRLQIGRRFPLNLVKQPDGSALKEGDIVILQVGADDFDNVTPDKKPGRSHEVELRIVSQPFLEALLHRAQAEVQQELLRLREQEREAIRKVDAAEKQWRETGKLRPEELDQLVQAEQVQQQIRARVGEKEDEGLRAEVNRILQTLKDNHMPRSGDHERMELVADELDRLARENLEQVEPLLTDARKQNELASSEPKPVKPTPPSAKNSLAEALAHQEEVENTLNQLLSELEKFSRLRDIKGQARAQLEEQRKINQQTSDLRAKSNTGDEPMTPEQRAEQQRVAGLQARQAGHVDQLLGRMERLAEEETQQAEEKARLAEEREKSAKEKLGRAKEKERLALDQPDPAKAKLLEEEAAQLREEAAQMQREAEALRDSARILQEEAQALREAAQAGRKGDAAGNMKSAAKNIEGSQLNQAGKAQQAGTQAMEQVVKALEDRREDELDRLIKRMRRAEQKLAELENEQERLRKKVEEARQLKDPKEREAELQRLAREQERLRQQAQELAQELTRMRAGRASDAMSRAAGRMEDAGQQLSRNQGGDAENEQEDALQRLQNARRELQQAREELQEELARERLAKVADLIKHLKERQEAELAESARIHKELLERGNWTAGTVRNTLSGRAQAQKVLAQDTAGLAEQKLKDAAVFARLLHRSADAMQEAELKIRERQKTSFDRYDQKLPLDVPAENAADADIQKLQRDAVRRLDQLIDALKPEKGVAMRPPDDGGAGEQPMGRGRPEGDGIPPLAQLKVLRALQEEVNQRTAEFAKKHPDLSKLTPKEKAELAAIKQDQAEVSELLEELTAAPKGGRMTKDE